MQLFIPDVYLGEDGNLSILLEVMAGVMESVFLANQITSEDMFVKTANENSLEKWGEQYGRPRKSGTVATGTLLFTGEGGTPIPLDAEVAYDPGTGEDPRYFVTTETDTIPNPGIATAPTTADGGAGALVAGTFEHAVTFVTAEGETAIGALSTPLVLGASKQVNLTAIPVGGPGTTDRKIYRQKDLGGFKYVKTVAGNVTTTTTDNVAEGALGAAPPAISTAERVRLDAASEEPGEIYNVLPNTVTTLTNVPDGILSVTNTSAFVGGTEQEASEDFREQLLKAIRAPGTGSPEDIRVWAEAVEGVESATVFPNDNLGTPTNGHVTVRISGPGGTVPGAPVIAAVLAEIQSKDVSNATIHVTTFTPTSTDVTVDVTLDTGYVLADVTPAVQAGITEYTNSLDVGETWRVTGAEASVWGLPGIIDLVVTTPASNQATGATSKRVAGTITVV